MIKKRDFHRREAFALAALACIATWAGCRSSGQDSAKPTQAHPAELPVRYVKVVQQAIPDTLDLAAKVQPDPTKVVHIFPPASGRVVALSVKPGDHVRRGQAVAVLNSSDVASARSDYAKASIEAGRATNAR